MLQKLQNNVANISNICDIIYMVNLLNRDAKQKKDCTYISEKLIVPTMCLCCTYIAWCRCTYIVILLYLHLFRFVSTKGILYLRSVLHVETN